MTKTLVLFDIDGTLLYSNKIDSRCFADTYQTIYERPFPSIDWRDYPHVTDHTIFSSVIRQHFDRPVEAAEVDVFQQAFVELIRKKRQEEPDAFREVPAARSAFEELSQDERFVCGIATGGWRRPALVKLEHVGIRHEGIPMCCADERVSREDILNDAIEQAHVQHDNIERIVYLGDAIWDVQTTRNMQLPFIGIRLSGDEEVLTSAGAGVVLQDYRDHAVLLEAIETAPVPN